MPSYQNVTNTGTTNGADEDMIALIDRDWEDFVAEKNAPGMMLVNPDSYSDVIIFLESVLSARGALKNTGTLQYYRKLAAQEWHIGQKVFPKHYTFWIISIQETN